MINSRGIKRCVALVVSLIYSLHYNVNPVANILRYANQFFDWLVEN